MRRRTLLLIALTAPALLMVSGVAGVAATNHIYCVAGLVCEGTDTIDPSDWMHGSEGDDTMNAKGGHDYLYGEAGVDTLNGDEGSDELFAELGPDPTTLGADTLSGGPGSDQLFSWSGDDIMRGDEDPDVVYGGVGDNTIYGGGEGDDRVDSAASSDDKVYGEAGDDLLIGHWGTDKVYGGVGHDNLDGGLGADGLYGGEGNDNVRTGGDWRGDPYRFRPDRRKDTVNCGPGEDTVKYEKGIDKVAKDCETKRP